MTPLCVKIMNDYAASFWLKQALTTAFERDSVDALNDAEILVKALRENLDDVYRAVNEVEQQ